MRAAGFGPERMRMTRWLVRKAGVGLIEPRFGAWVEPAERVWEDERP